MFIFPHWTHQERNEEHHSNWSNAQEHWSGNTTTLKKFPKIKGRAASLWFTTQWATKTLGTTRKGGYGTCRAKALSAGIGMMAATKKANMLLTDVRRTLTPVRFRHSPICSWKPEEIFVKPNLCGHTFVTFHCKQWFLLSFLTYGAKKFVDWQSWQEKLVQLMSATPPPPASEVKIGSNLFDSGLTWILLLAAGKNKWNRFWKVWYSQRSVLKSLHWRADIVKIKNTGSICVNIYRCWMIARDADERINMQHPPWRPMQIIIFSTTSEVVLIKFLACVFTPPQIILSHFPILFLVSSCKQCGLSHAQKVPRSPRGKKIPFLKTCSKEASIKAEIWVCSEIPASGTQRSLIIFPPASSVARKGWTQRWRSTAPWVVCYHGSSAVPGDCVQNRRMQDQLHRE